MEEYKEFEVKGPYRRDTSIGVRPSENGVIDSVVMTQSVDGGKMQDSSQGHENTRNWR